MSLDAGTTQVCGRPVRQRPPEFHDERPRRVSSPAPLTPGDHRCQDSLGFHPTDHNRPAVHGATPVARAGRARPAAGMSRARCPIRSPSGSAGSRIPRRPTTMRHPASPSPGPAGRTRSPPRSWPRSRRATAPGTRYLHRRKDRRPAAGRRGRCGQPRRPGPRAGRAPPGRGAPPGGLEPPGRLMPPGRPEPPGGLAPPGHLPHLRTGPAGSRRCWRKRSRDPGRPPS